MMDLETPVDRAVVAAPMLEFAYSHRSPRLAKCESWALTSRGPHIPKIPSLGNCHISDGTLVNNSNWTAEFVLNPLGEIVV